MTQKHTPGPWAVMPSSNPKNGSAWRDIVSTGCEFSPSYVGEALERDATLIASAPDLLADNDRLRQINADLVAALEKTTRRLENMLRGKVSVMPPDLTQAIAVLAKAKAQP